MRSSCKSNICRDTNLMHPIWCIWCPFQELSTMTTWGKSKWKVSFLFPESLWCSRPKSFQRRTYDLFWRKKKIDIFGYSHTGGCNRVRHEGISLKYQLLCDSSRFVFSFSLLRLFYFISFYLHICRNQTWPLHELVSNFSSSNPGFFWLFFVNCTEFL